MLEKITGYAPVKSAGNAKKAGRTGASGAFEALLGLSDEAAAPASVSDTAPVSSLLSLQEISDDDIRRKRVIQHGHSMLDALENLRQRLLLGQIPPHMLETLRHQLAVQREQLSDPRLMDIMDDIELRLAVELAKLEMTSQSAR